MSQAETEARAQKVRGGLPRENHEETEARLGFLTALWILFGTGKGRLGWLVALVKGREIPREWFDFPLSCFSRWGESGEARAAEGARERRAGVVLNYPEPVCSLCAGRTRCLRVALMPGRKTNCIMKRTKKNVPPTANFCFVFSCYF